MDRMLELQAIEAMRKMMMIQEEIFKHQVQELHRVYNVQEKLRQELGFRLIKQQKAKIDAKISMFSIWHQAPTETGHSFQAFITRDDPKETSNSCSGGNMSRMPIRHNSQMPSESTSNINHLSEDEDDSKRIDQENDVEVELTLSIGHCTRSKRSKNESNRLNQVQELSSSSSRTNNGKPSSSTNNSSSVCQENRRPHWLLQDLSLNRT